MLAALAAAAGVAFATWLVIVHPGSTRTTTTTGGNPSGQPGPYPAFGYNDRWSAPAFSSDPNPAHSPIQLAKNEGVTVVRYGVNWDEVGGQAGDAAVPCDQQAGWSALDTTYQELTGVSACASPPSGYVPPIRPVLYLRGAPAPYARWWDARAKSCTSTVNPSTPDHLITPVVADTAQANAAWRGFVKNVANRYPLAKGIEVWNEPNLRKYWGNCPPDPNRYAQLLDLAHEAIVSSSHPNVPIVLAGMSPVGSHTRANWLTYLRQVFDARGLPAPVPALFDVMGLHPYRSAQDKASHPDRTFAQVAGEDVDLARAFLAAHGAASKPVWVTEVGVTTGGSPNHHVVNADQQAIALRAIYETFRKLGVPVVLIHRFADVSPNALSGEAPGYGVVRRPPGFGLKPAYQCLAQARGRLGSCPR
jgi:hypothetical protein